MSERSSGPDRLLLRLARALEAVSDGVGHLVSWLSVAMVLITFAVVVLRYAFDLGWIGMQESVTYMHAVLFLAGSSYTLRHHGHVRVTLDGQNNMPVSKGETVHIHKDDHLVRLIHPSGHDHFDILRAKLGWAEHRYL